MDYRLLIRDEFETRRQRNPRYSMRAFARHLGVTSAYLSLIFSGKRTLSEAMGFRFAAKLRWPKSRKKQFLNLIRLERSNDEEAKEILRHELRTIVPELEFLELKHHQFELVSRWVHFAIAELTTLEDFRSDPRWIAKRLGISAVEAEQAIARLTKVGLLIRKDGRYSKAKADYRMTDTPSSAIRQYHKTHLHSAVDALENQDFNERDISGTTFAFDREKMVEAKALIREFRERMNSLCSRSDRPDSVYQLAVQFFRLDKEIR